MTPVIEPYNGVIAALLAGVPVTFNGARVLRKGTKARQGVKQFPAHNGGVKG